MVSVNKTKHPGEGLGALEFLDMVFAEVGDGEHVCVSKASDVDGKTLFWNVEDDSEVFRSWAARPHRAKAPWYFCVSTVDGEMNDKGTALRRRTKNLVRQHCLVLDDIGTKAVAPPVAPAWKMETSAGNFQWGYLIEPNEDVVLYEAIVQWLHEQGWGDAGAGGAYRVMRLPGSCNVKPGRGEWLSVCEVVDDVVWDLRVLAAALGCDADALDLSGRGGVKGPSGGVMVTSEGKIVEGGYVDPVLQWLSDEGYVRSDDGEWVQVLCPWHAQHTSGSDAAGFSPLGRGGEWAETRAFRCLHDHCKDKKIGDFAEWIAEMRGPKVRGFDPLPLAQGRYVFVGKGSKVVDLWARAAGVDCVMELNDWSNMNYRKVPVDGRDDMVLMRTAFLEGRGTLKAADVGYFPSLEDKVFIDRGDGGLMLNLYVPPVWGEVDGEPSLLLSHIEYLIPDAREREVFLDWLAYKVQHPERRSYAVVMVAEDAYGTGRSVLIKFLERMMPSNVKPGTLGQLIGRSTSADANYNDWGSNCQFLVVEEAKGTVEAKEFYDGFETFKKLVDPSGPSRVRVNPKFGRTREDLLYFNALILTNHADALAIPNDPDERRIMVITNPVERRSRAEYDALYDELRDARGLEHVRFYWWLRRRAVTNDMVYPPMTDAKRRMMRSAVSPSEELHDLVWECMPDIVTKDMVYIEAKKAVRELGYQQTFQGKSLELVTNRIWKQLEDVPGACHKNGFRPRIGGRQQRIKLKDLSAVREVDLSDTTWWRAFVTDD